MRSPRAELLAAAAALAAAGAGGCARDEAATAVGGRITVAMTEYRLDPQTVRAGPGALRIAVVNRGREPHRLAIGLARSALRVTPLLRPGARGVLAVTLPPGRYRLFCPLANHDTLGLDGTVEVS